MNSPLPQLKKYAYSLWNPAGEFLKLKQEHLVNHLYANLHVNYLITVMPKVLLDITTI